jgi:BMFP domain-containing protein YqiC
MSENDETSGGFDPLEMMKQMRNANLDAWAKMMTDLVNTDAYAGANAELINTWFNSTSPFRKALDSAIAQALASLHLASREDFSAFAERLTHIEMRLDDIESKLDETLSQLERKG